MDSTHTLRSIVLQAVQMKSFNALSPRRAMSPVGRIPVRPAHLKGSPRSGAVLGVLFGDGHALHVLLIKRRDSLRHHPGQISFPGGRLEHGETPQACALRETHEEIGIAPDALDIAGFLEPVYIIVSDFCIQPFVAWHEGIPDCKPDPREVESVLRVPLACLSTPEARAILPKNILGCVRDVPGFMFNGHHIWGATAILLNEIIARLKTAGWRE